MIRLNLLGGRFLRAYRTGEAFAVVISRYTLVELTVVGTKRISIAPSLRVRKVQAWRYVP